MKALRQSITALIALPVLFSACDIVNDDVAPKQISAIVYALPSKPALLNMTAVTNDAELVVNGTIATSFGKFESILDGKYLLYTPGADFSGNEEEVTLNISNSKNKIVNTLRVQAKSLEGSCAVSGVYDYAKITDGSEIEIDLLDNDVFCNVGYNGGIISQVAYEGPSEGVLALGPGREAKFIYKPTPGFKGKIKVIYNLGINWIKSPDGVSSAEVLQNPNKYLEAFTTAMVEIDVE